MCDSLKNSNGEKKTNSPRTIVDSSPSRYIYISPMAEIVHLEIF